MSKQPRKTAVYKPSTEPTPATTATTPTTTIQKSELRALLADAPIAEMSPTQRYYGETFYPKHMAFMDALRRLASE